MKRALLACGVLIIAGLAGGALGAPAPRTPPAPAPAPAPRAASLAPHPKAPAPPAPLAARPRPGKNVSTPLGGPAKYDAKKGAMLGGAALPH